MLRSDLAAAEIPFADDAGRVFDFHSLRGQFVTELGRRGVRLQEAQKLARHSDPKLTIGRYSHASLEELGQALGKLPALGRVKGASPSALADVPRPLLEALALTALALLAGGEAGSLVAPPVAPTSGTDGDGSGRPGKEERQQVA